MYMYMCASTILFAVDLEKGSESGYMTYDASNIDKSSIDVEECSTVNPDHSGIDRLWGENKVHLHMYI